MAADYEKFINNLKESLDKARNMRIRAEARLEQLNKQKQDLINEIEALGVKPEELEKEIERLKSEIEQLIKKPSELLPSNIGQQLFPQYRLYFYSIFKFTSKCIYNSY